MWRTYNHSSSLFLVSSNVSFVNLPNDVHTYFRTCCFCETYWMSTIRQHWSQEIHVLRLIFCQLFYFIVQKNNTNKNNFMSILLQVCKTFFFSLIWSHAEILLWMFLTRSHSWLFDSILIHWMWHCVHCFISQSNNLHLFHCTFI